MKRAVSNLEAESNLQRRSQIRVRLFVELRDAAQGVAFAQTARERLVPVGDILRLETKPYWKIPAWSEVLVLLQPGVSSEPASAFREVLKLLGEGWEPQVAGEENGWAVWNLKPGSSFFSDHVKWANVELFVGPLEPVKFRHLEEVKVIGDLTVQNKLRTKEWRLTGQTGIVTGWSAPYADGHQDYAVHFNTFGEGFGVSEECLESTGRIADRSEIRTRSRLHQKRRAGREEKKTDL